MKLQPRRWQIFAGMIALVFFIWVIVLRPKYPMALIRVEDGSGHPIAGAVIRPDGLRTKPGPYASSHYGWGTAHSGVPDKSVRTDKSGSALVPYPTYVFEKIETGQISFSVEHPDFVPDRPFRVVTGPFNKTRNFAINAWPLCG